MKKIYLSLGLALFLAVVFYSAGVGFAVTEPDNRDTGYCLDNPETPICGVMNYNPPKSGGGGGSPTPTPSSVPPASGVLSFTPFSVKDKGVFAIKLSGAENVPASTVARLWIDPDNSGSFKNFGTWLTVGELKKGVQRTMNCSAYSSYDPSGAVDVRGKVLNQRLFISYEGLGYGSEIVSHIKDCSVASGGGSTPPVTMTPTGPATCSVAPGSATIDQNGTLSFKVSSSQSSTGGNYVYVVAKDFSSGIYSDLGVGKVIPAGGTSVDFKIYALNNAEPGNKTFKVYCSTGCPVSGCPSGGSAEIIGQASVNLAVTGTNPSGGGSGSGGGSSGSASCGIPNVSIPPNSSMPVSVSTSVGGAGEVSLNGSSGADVSVSPVFPHIKYEGGLARGREQASAIVRTGSNFTGGSYSLTCDLPSGRAVATGSAFLPAINNPSGKIKLSQVEYLGDTMFPISECTYDVRGCQQEFYYGNSGPRIMSYNGSTVLVGGVQKALYPAPAKGTLTTPRVFSLADPMNPTKIASLDGPSITPSEDAFGDFGAALSAESVAWSQDGRYRAIVSSQSWLFVSADGGRKIRVANGMIGPASIVKSGSEYVLVHGRGAINITNPRDFENYDEQNYKPLPSNFPELGEGIGINYGTKIVSDDGSYIIVIPDDGISRLVSGFTHKIKLFSVNQKEPLAELQLSEDNLNPLSKSYSIRGHGKVAFPGGMYVYTIANNARFAVDVFKVEYAAKRITQIAKSVALPIAYNVGATAGFDVGGGNAGLVAYFTIDKGATANPYGNYEGRFRAFLFSDLAAGRVVDVLVNSPISVSAETGDITTGGGALGNGGTVGPVEIQGDSFSRNSITYMYTAASFGQDVKVWKFEAASGGGSTGGGTPPATVPPGGTPGTGVGCDFTLTPTPETLTVARGSSFAVYGLKASDNTDKTCFVSVTAQAIKDSSGNRIISPSSAAATIIGPGMQNIFYFNLSNPPAGSYDIPIKAYARGVATKTLNLKLLVQ